MDHQTAVISLLRKHKLKVTSHRLGLLTVLMDRGEAVSQTDFHAELAGIDRVTLYRNLQTLMDQGIIHQAMVDDHKTYYALCSERCNEEAHDHQHVHFKCERCDSVQCIPTESAVKLSLPGHVVEQVNVQVKGVCSSCKKGN